MQRIVVVGPTAPFRGGISYHTTLLFRYLVRRYPGARLFAPWRQYPAWLFPGRDDREPGAVAADEPGVAHVLDGCDPSTYLRLGLALRRARVDVLVVPWWVSFWAPHVLALACSARARELVLLVHNAREHEGARWKRALARAVLARADRFVVHSEADRAHLAASFPGRRIDLAPHPSYEELFPSDLAPAEARREVASRHGFDPAGPLVLFFGFVRPYKGLPDLVLALSRMRVPARLLVVGEFWGDARAELSREVARLGLGNRVLVVDEYVPAARVASYFRAADVVALPYRSGTGSGILMTAFAHRRPVVATRTGSLADCVRDGATGRLVPPGDAGALAAALDEVVSSESLRAAMSREIDRDVRARFGWDALVDAVVGASPTRPPIA